MEWIEKLWSMIAGLTGWDYVGLAGQVSFGSRFVIQWIVTERKKESTFPLAFWYLSLVGTIILLVYSIHLANLVFILGFSLNLLIYLRNLYFIHLRRQVAAEGAVRPSDKGRPGPR